MTNRCDSRYWFYVHPVQIHAELAAEIHSDRRIGPQRWTDAPCPLDRRKALTPIFRCYDWGMENKKPILATLTAALEQGILSAIVADADIGRNALAPRVCERFDFRDNHDAL
ncbi:MAG: hypothetical protein OXD38_02870 [Aestuariivita sp.]|nr:hypothetical protein [Aestuariivita sp.]